MFTKPPISYMQEPQRFKVSSYRTWPATSEDEGETVRISVGRVDQQTKQKYVFEKVLPQPSKLIVVTFSRPAGLVFSENSASTQVLVSEVVKGSQAGQKFRLAQFDKTRLQECAVPGDVLRAVTATAVVSVGKWAFGQRLERHVVLFGADGQRWPKIAGALKQGLAQDGSVTFVLERATPK